MLIALSAKNKLGFVTGEATKPDSSDPTYNAWIRCNDIVTSWILSNLERDIAKSVLYYTSASEIWKDLEERFGINSGTQLFSLEQELSEITQGNLSVAEFYTKMKVVWDEMNVVNPLPTCTCNLCTCNLTKRIYTQQQDQDLCNL